MVTIDSRVRWSSSPREFALLITLALATFVFMTAETMPVALLTWMAPSLDSSYERIGLLMTGYGAVVALTSIPLTRLTMRMSRRRLLCGAFGLFTASTFAAALADSYAVLLSARIVTALSHAIFWSLVATTAASLFAGNGTSRVIAVVFSGGSLGAVIGVPGTAWIGQHVGWRLAFGVVGLLGLLVFVSLCALLVDVPRADEARSVGNSPDRRQYGLVLATAAVAVVAVFTAQTYVTVFLTDASGFFASSIAPTLLVAGVAGVLGVSAAGWIMDRRPFIGMIAILVLAAVALLALYPLATIGPAVVILVALRALAFGGLGTAVQVRILSVAPGSTDIASAASSSVFNAGIGAGALLGGGVIATAGARETTLVGGIVAVAAVAMYMLPAAWGRAGS